MAKLSDDKIVSMVRSGISQSVGYSDSRLSKERVEIMEYYNGEAPRPVTKGLSKYVSYDVWDAHESLKSQLLETFSGNLQPVTFTPMGADDVETARVATEWCSHVVFAQNDGFGTIRDVIDDALLGRAGVAKVWWEERHDDETLEMSNSNLEALIAHIDQNPDVKVKSVELDPTDDTMITRAELTVTKNKSQIKILPLPPEEFFVGPRCVSLETADLCGHRYRRTYSELLKDGYPKSKLQDLIEDDGVWLSTEPELIERHQQTDDIIGTRVIQWDQDASKTCIVYEAYTMMDPDDTGKESLYQVIIAGDTLLHMEKVPRRPFVTFVPLPRPHAFWGTSYDRLVVPIQNARTMLTRSILDHAAITTSPRFIVARNAVANPRELMEGRVGGIINVSRMDGLAPMPQAPLNPFIFQTIGMLDEDKEQRTGVSRLSTGMNKDAVSNQNSGEMIENLVNLSQVRQKVIARNFAEQFLRNLYLMIYQLTVENEDRQHVIEIAGAWVDVDATGWPERDKLTVTFSLGYGEKELEVKKLLGVDAYLSKDPQLSHLYTPDKRYNVIKKSLEAGGIKDVVSVIGTPQQAAIPPQPTPMMLADLEVKKADAAVKNANAQAAVEKLKLDQLKAQNSHEVEMARLKLEAMKETNATQLARDKLAHTVSIDAFETTLQQWIASKAEKTSATTFVDPSR